MRGLHEYKGTDDSYRVPLMASFPGVFPSFRLLAVLVPPGFSGGFFAGGALPTNGLADGRAYGDAVLEFDCGVRL